jgi:protein-S-isoprenylcysteine O-methyltransferase Ste14
MFAPPAPRGPNIRVPPLFFGGGFLIGLWVEASVKRIQLVDGSAAAQTLANVGWVVAILGLSISLWGILTFQLAGTTMFPFEPASRLVRQGPYRFTRNPMYVGATVSYIGIALIMNVGWPLVLLPLVLWGLDVLVIREEEKYLSQTFGEDYAAYRKQVRRWI